MEHILLRKGEKTKDGDEYLWFADWLSIPVDHGQYEITKDYSEYTYPEWKPPGCTELSPLGGKPLPSELLLIYHAEGLGGTTLSELPHRRKLAIPYGDGDPRIPFGASGGNLGKSESVKDYVLAGNPRDAIISTKLSTTPCK